MKARYLGLVIVFLTVLSCANKEKAKPLEDEGTNNALTYSNPIFPGDYPDPSILRDGEDFYMVHSSFEYYPDF